LTDQEVKRMSKKWIAVIVTSLVLVLVVTSVVMAQDTTPTTPSPKKLPFRAPWGMKGGWDSFDAIAKTLNLTPTQLFEQLHSGKTLEEIASAQGVDLQKLQDAAKATRIETMKKAIDEAMAAGKITKEQGDWMLKGLENGWGCGGRGFGRGFGFGGRGFTPKLKGGSFIPALPQGSQQG
jgi:hypothetical protein